jgi:glycosyltransferase involved in cell wall biosynthesis
VGPKERAELLGNAKAVLMPTFYLEPFGGVNVEAQLCGTPVITSDWGAFPETVLHGITGYRCRVFEEFCWAVKNIHNIKPKDCRDWSENNYSMERIGKMYEEYFQRIHRLFGKGWYETNDERNELKWLERYYPNN